MDPALWEIFAGDDDIVEAVVRYHPGATLPPALVIVSDFGGVATCRLPREAILAVRAHPAVLSLKASLPMRVEREPDESIAAIESLATRERGAGGGRGVVVGVVDWGIDFAHRAFRAPDGSTRFRAIWDQRAAPGAPAPEPYGYGRLFSRRDIDAALADPEPYRALGYHPADADRDGSGTHGTHVLDIAAGSWLGLARVADLAFVHLAERGRAQDGLASSTSVLEAVDFIGRLAGDGPCVVNLSMGRHGGPHDGSTLVERALDLWATVRPGRVAVHSGGNYYRAFTHTDGRVGAEPVVFAFEVPEGDPTPNELDLWYGGGDELALTLRGPGDSVTVTLPLGARAPVVLGGFAVGRAYHRQHDPNNGENNIHVYLDPSPVTYGRWTVELAPVRVADGHFDAWIERDPARAGQARMAAEHATSRHTTGTICHALHSITVGACDGTLPGRPPADFASAGPCRGGRPKPDLAAYGVGIVAARSAPAGAEGPEDGNTSKSGASMAAPQVAGTVALLLSERPDLDAADVRRILVATADALGDDGDRDRLGAGILNPARALAALRPESPKEAEMSEPEFAPEASGDIEAASFPFLEELEAPRARDREPLERRLGDVRAPALAECFDLVLRGRVPVTLEVVGLPGGRCAAPLAGDLVIQRAVGEGRLARGFEVLHAQNGTFAVRPLGGAATTQFRAHEGPALRPDTAVLRLRQGYGEDTAAEVTTGPFAVGHLATPIQKFVPMPLTYEDIVPNSTHSGAVIQRTRCSTLAQVSAMAPRRFRAEAPFLYFHDDLITSLSAVPTLWQTGTGGRLEAELDLVVYFPADPAQREHLPPGNRTFPLAIIAHGNHGVCSISPSGPGPGTGVTVNGQSFVQRDAATFGPRIRSNDGYSGFAAGSDYLQEELASQGIISVSVSQNPANFFNLLVETRADLVLAALAEMRRLHNLAGSTFRGRIDFDKLAFIGHSRGGDAVVRAALKPHPGTLRTVVQLASTDSTGLVRGAAPAAAAGNVDFVTAPMRLDSSLNLFHLAAWGSRDGDMTGEEDVRSGSNAHPMRHYDRSSCHRAFFFWQGATHNRFNRIWTDAQEAEIHAPDDYLDLAHGNFLTRPDQEARTVELVSGCLRFVLNGDAAARPLLTCRARSTIAPARPISAMWKNGRRLLTIDQFDDPRPDRNTMGGRNTPPASGLVDEIVVANENPAGAGVTSWQFMHIDRALRGSFPSGGVPGVVVPTGSPPGTISSGRWRSDIPPGDGDFHAFTLITLRVTKRWDLPHVGTDTPPVARVRLTDRHAPAPHSFDLAATGIVTARPEVRRITLTTGGTVDLTKIHFETLEVPLASYQAAGVDLRSVASVEVEMVGVPGEPVYVDTVSLVEL